MTKIIILDVSKDQGSQTAQVVWPLRFLLPNLESATLIENYIASAYGIKVYLEERALCNNKPYYWFCDRSITEVDIDTLRAVFDGVYYIEISTESGYTPGTGYVAWLLESEYRNLLMED